MKQYYSGKVSDIKNLTEPIKVTIDTPIERIIDKFLEQPELRNIFVVDSDNKLLGRVRRKSLLKAKFPEYLKGDRLAEKIQFMSARVGEDVMASHIISLNLEDDLSHALEVFLNTDYFDLAVVNHDNELMGTLTIWNILQLQKRT